MKIVYNLLEGVNCGGIERIVFAKANWLSKQGHDVTIITTDRNGRNPFFHLNENIKWIDLGINYRQDWTSPIRKLLKHRTRTKLHQKALSKAILSIRPDISISVFGAEAEFLHKIPHAGKKIIEIHFSRYFRLSEFKLSIQYLANIIHTLIDRNIVSKYDAFISLTQEDRILWGNLQNIHVIPNFINQRMPNAAKLDSKQVIAVGRLSHQKGYDRMISAWKIVAQKHPDWHLNIYGTGELYNKLQHQITKDGLSQHITIHAPMSPVESAMMESSFLLLSSHHEGLPMVVLEAMSCGLPTVSFSCKCGPKDIIGNQNGIIVPNGDVKALATAACSLIENEDLRKRLGHNAYLNIQNYTADKIMPKWEQLFDELVRKDQ